MARAKKNEEVISFKVDREMMEVLKNLPNRSEFIRSALLRAFDNICPLCRGYGYLNPKQKDHWQRFENRHKVAECPDCHELHLVCVDSEE